MRKREVAKRKGVAERKGVAKKGVAEKGDPAECDKTVRKLSVGDCHDPGVWCPEPRGQKAH